MKEVSPSPRFRFSQSKGNVSAHRELIASETFEKALDYALLEYHHQLSVRAGNDGDSAMAMGLKLKGVMEYIEILKWLGESAPKPTGVIPNDNLNTKEVPIAWPRPSNK